MKAFYGLAGVAVIGVASAALAAGHWGYSGQEGPEHWAKLDPAYKTCANGKHQSPIDLRDFVEVDMLPLHPEYKTDAAEIVNNGHTVQVNYAPGSTLPVDGRTFELKQFHFHAPSENTLHGKRYPLEVHLVHADASGRLGVVGVLFDEGAANPLLEKLWEKMPGKGGEKGALPAGLNAAELLPARADYFRFNGSLTTPPCSEGVLWMVMKATNTASKEQIDRFTTTIGFANSRPVQPLNNRPVLE
jgi:carbonic anhydrase